MDDTETNETTSLLNKNIINNDANNIIKNNDKFGRYNKCQQTLLFIVMLLTNVLGPLSTEAQVPALQDIAIDLNTSSRYVQLTITIYMIFFGISQLAFGTLSDIYGRRNTLIVGLTVYVLTNIGCALSPNIISLNIFRAIQATGSGAGMVIVYAIARDVFEQEERTKVLGFLGGLRPIVIASSPLFGGTVSAFLGWRYIFWIIGGLSLGLLIFVYFILPETMPDNGVSIRTVNDYWVVTKRLIKERVFIGLILISGAVYAGVFIMFNEFSFVMENTYGFNEFQTGLLCGGIIFGLMVGSIISILFKKFNPFKVISYGILQILICSSLLILPCILFSKTFPEFIGINIWWTVIPLFLYVCSDGIMLPHLISTALEPFKDCAGTASALAGFWRFFTAAVIALIVSSISVLHLPTLHLGTASMGIIAVIIFLFSLFRAETTKFLPINMRSNNINNNSNIINNKINIGYKTINDPDNDGVGVEYSDDDE